jgi:hypothetical protein
MELRRYFTEGWPTCSEPMLLWQVNCFVTIGKDFGYATLAECEEYVAKRELIVLNANG